MLTYISNHIPENVSARMTEWVNENTGDTPVRILCADLIEPLPLNRNETWGNTHAAGTTVENCVENGVTIQFHALITGHDQERNRRTRPAIRGNDILFPGRFLADGNDETRYAEGLWAYDCAWIASRATREEEPVDWIRETNNNTTNVIYEYTERLAACALSPYAMSSQTLIDPVKILAEMWERITSGSLQEMMEERRLAEATRTQTEFARLMREHADNAIEGALERLALADSSFVQATRRLDTAQQEQRAAEAVVRTIRAEAPEPPTDEAIAEQWEQINRNVLIDRLSFTADNQLRIVTKMLRLEHPETRGQFAPLGRFKIDINMLAGNVHISNLDFQHEGYDHPHVRDGDFCTGAHGHELTRMVRNRDLIGTVNFLIGILQTVNANDDWGRRYYMWFNAAEAAGTLENRDGSPWAGDTDTTNA